jgi:putative ABC transport system permease protein
VVASASAVLLAETRRKPGRVLLTGLAIIVATVFAAGTMLFSETLRDYLTEGDVVTPAGAAAVVHTAELDELYGVEAADELVEQLTALDGVADAVGVWDASVSVDANGASTEWSVISDPMSGPLSRLEVPVQGSLPAGPGEVAISEQTAERTGLAPGGTITIPDDYEESERTFAVTGVVDVPADSEGRNQMFTMPDDVASLGGWLGQIDVAAASGTDDAELVQRVGDVVGNPAAIVSGEEQRTLEGESAAESVTAVLVGVGVFAGLAVVAAVVVVASTFRIVLTQRRTQLALLRCVGARRGQLIRAVLAEAVVTGLVAGLVGVGVAMLAGYGLLAVMQWSGMTDVPDLVVSWPMLAGVLLVAVLATVVAALAPALAAARIPPVAALGTAASGEVGTPRTGGRLAFAGLLVAAAAGLAVLGTSGGSPFVAMITIAVSGMSAFAAVIAAGPVLVRAIGASIGRLVEAVGRGPGRLARANAAQVPRRTAATISVLALGVGLTSALLVALATVQSGAEQQIAEQFPSEIVVSALEASTAEAFADQLSGDPQLVVRADGDAVLVDPAPGADVAAVRATVEEAAGASTDSLTVEFAGDARAELENQLAIASMIGLGLVGMTLLVAVVGVGVTLMLSVTERVQETGLLRAVGLSRPGVRAMVALEAGLSGTGAAVLGVVIGAVYGVLAVQALGLASGSVPLPVLQLVELVVAVVAVAMLAATVPAMRAGRVPPIRALRAA